MHISDASAQPALIGTRQAAEILGVPRTTLASRLAAGTIAPAIKLPGRTGAYLFDRAYIEQLAQEERRPALAAKKASEAGYAIQDQKTGAVIMESRRVNLGGGDAACLGYESQICRRRSWKCCRSRVDQEGSVRFPSASRVIPPCVRT